MIDVKVFPVTHLSTNCCLLTDKETGKMAVVDPGEKSDELIEEIKSAGSGLEYIFLTHGHYDHIGYAKQLSDLFGAKIVTGEATNDFLYSVMLNLSAYHPELKTVEPFSADLLLKDNDRISLGNTEFLYIATPGHTSGCGSFIADGKIFCGDCLFCESFGRIDLPTGDYNQIIGSFKKLKDLPGDYTVYPGHGSFSTLEHERKYNPLMRKL